MIAILWLVGFAAVIILAWFRWTPSTLGTGRCRSL